MRRRREQNNSKKLAILLIVIGVIVIVWLGTRDIPNPTETVTVDITEQVKG